MIRMKVKGIGIHPATTNYVMILTDEETDNTVPIWIGKAEAYAVALELEGAKAQRPLTHDLLKEIMTTYGLKLKKIVISDLHEATYYAKLYVERDGESIVFDSRPSDAVALALRMDSPIFASEELISKVASSERPEIQWEGESEEKSSSMSQGTSLDESEREELSKYIDEIFDNINKDDSL